ncbi:MAG: flagellar biosynthetic protein FliO [Burkholderiaceae bacterium]
MSRPTWVRAAALAALSIGPAAAWAVGAATAPSAPEAPSVLPMILALIFVLALIPAAVWLLKRLGAGQASGTGGLKVVGSLSLGARERLVMVDDGREFILLGVTAQSITRVGTQPRREMPATGPAFGTILKKAQVRDEA